MTDDNLALVRNMEEDLFNHRDPAAVDRYVSPAYTLRTAEEGAPSGREAIKAYIAAYLDGFPDLHISIDQLLAVGDKVVGVSLSPERTKATYLASRPPGGPSG